MNNTLPIIKLTIDPNDEKTGVELVSLVDRPAIEMTWQAFNAADRPLRFEIQNEEKRIVSGPIMVADLPIYRRDEDRGEYYVTFDADTIRAIVYKFFKNGRGVEANTMHAEIVPDVFLIESHFVSEAHPVPAGFPELTVGSWFGSYKIDNDDVWAKVKDGTFNGFSVEGMFRDAVVDAEEKDIIEEIIKQITQ